MTEGSPGPEIGRRIRDIREAQLRSRADVAERAGLSVPGIAHLELGGIERPRRRTIEKLANALGVSVGVLMGEEPYHPKVRPAAKSLEELLQASGQARNAILKNVPEGERNALLEAIDARDAELRRSWSESGNPDERAQLWEAGRQLHRLRLEVESSAWPIRVTDREYVQ
jgi:transcriptional regulator with XRE-family HTH domain